MSRFTALLLLLVCAAGGSFAQAAQAPLDELLAQVRESRTKAAEEHRQREQRFLAEQVLQQKRLREARQALQVEQEHSEHLQQDFERNETKLAELQAKLHERSGVLMELFGFAKQAAGDTQAVLQDSLISTQFPERVALVEKLAEQKSLPAIADLEDLWFSLQQEMTESGKVVSYAAPVIARNGKPQERKVTRIGAFNAVSEGRFLRHLPTTGSLQELSRQPTTGQRKMAVELENATDGMQPMIIDPSSGAVLALLVQVPDLLERVQQGKAVGYIILALALVGMLMALERLVHLMVIGGRIKKQLNSQTPIRNNPLGRVMAVHQENPGLDTETLELMIDETVLKDLPKLHRGLPALKILAAVAPLLGLLGTVVGLIETFQSITLFGTGDPKLMAGGISQALVTTVLGLITAIPLILMHSGLSSKSRSLVSILEEQSAGIIARHAERRGQHAAVA